MNIDNIKLCEQNLKDIKVDFTTIPGLSELSVQTIVSKVGLDMDKWSTEKHFTSWLGLIVLAIKLPVARYSSMAFRMAAFNLGRGKSALAGFYRRIKGRDGTLKAITATARKLTCMFYRLLRYGQDYVENGIEIYEKQYQKIMVKNLQKQATRLGFSVVKIEPSLKPVC